MILKEHSGKLFSRTEMNQLFNVPISVLKDCVFMKGHEEWCVKMGQGKTCKWLYKYDEFMENYDDILSRRLARLK